MTREEAIKGLKSLVEVRRKYCDMQTMKDEIECLDMAIKALEQEPCDDAINRQAVLAAMQKNHRSGGRDIDGDYIEGNYRECLYDDIISLPSVTSGSTSCDDAISRQMVLDKAVYTETEEGWSGRTVDVKDIEALPPVAPQQKIGKWIIVDDCEHFIAKCSECGRIEDSRMINKYPYCHCGAKMQEVEE